MPFNPEMLRIGAARGLAWQTDWSAGSMQPGFAAQDYQSVKLVPQFWGGSDVNFEHAQDPLSTVVLGFNEPDQSRLGGSGMSVQQAVSMWMRLVAKAHAAGYTMFVAPSIAGSLPSRYTDAAGGSEWLPQFLEQCLAISGCPETITFLGFHLYEPKCLTDPAMVRHWSMDIRVGSMKKLMAEFNAKGMNIQGLWLTEFAGRSGPMGLCRTLAQQRGWLEVIVPMLNAEPAVVAYSWFSYGEGRSPFFLDNANLWDYNTNQLNELGLAYFRLCNSQAAIPASSPSSVVVPALPAPSPAFAPAVPQTATPQASPPYMPVVPGTTTPTADSGNAWRSFFLTCCLLLALAGAAGAAFVWWPKTERGGFDMGFLEPAVERIRSSWKVAKRAIRVDLAGFSDRMGCESLMVCGESSGDESDLQQRRELEAFRVGQPRLGASIANCCALIGDRLRFQSEAELAFRALRQAVSAQPAMQGLPGGPGGPYSLAAAPAKVQVLEFILRFAESHQFYSYRGEAKEVIAQLEQNPAWKQALRQNANIHQRWGALFGVGSV